MVELGVELCGASLLAGCHVYARHFTRVAIPILVLGLLFAFVGSAESQIPTSYDDVSTPEGWAWSQIKQGLPADFGDHCGVKLDPRAQDDPWWRDDPCRTVQASFIVDLLTKSSLHDTIPYKGIVLVNAKIVGDVDLGFATIDRPLGVVFSRFEGAMQVDYARADSPVDFEGSVFLSQLSANAYRSESNLNLTRAMILGKMILSGAKIKGDLVMNGANLADDLEALELEVGGSLMMHPVDANKASFKTVSLANARVAGVVNMVGVSLAGELDAQGLRVGASLLMYSLGATKATFRKVVLVDAEVASNVDMIGASIAGKLQAGSLRVGGSLLMHVDGTNEATFDDIYLVGAKVTRNLELNGARINGDLFAESVQIGGSLIAYRTRFKGVDLGLSTIGGQVNMPNSIFDGDVTLKHIRVTGDVLLGSIGCDGRFDVSTTQIGGNLDFTGAKLNTVDLGGASIVGDMQLGDESSRVTWVAPKN